MQKTLLAVVLMACATAHATVTTSMDGDTSFVHLGSLSMAECKSLMSSPVVAGMKVAVDGRLTSADDATCRAGAKVDLVSTTPVTKTTATGVTSWPLTKSECAALAAKLLEKGAIRINGSSVDQPVQITSACSKSSNSVTLTR